MLGEIVQTFTASLNGFELHATSGTEKSAAALDQIGDAAGGELLDLVVEHALITVVNTENLDAFEERGANDRTSCCVHAGAVAAGGHNRNRIFDSHFLTSSFGLTNRIVISTAI